MRPRKVISVHFLVASIDFSLRLTTNCIKQVRLSKSETWPLKVRLDLGKGSCLEKKLEQHSR